MLPRNDPQVPPRGCLWGKTLPNGVLPVAVAEAVRQAPSCTAVSHCTSEGMGLEEGSHRWAGDRLATGSRGPAGDWAPGPPDRSSLTKDPAGILHVCVSTCALVGGEVSEGRGGRRLSFPIEKGLPKPENRGRTTECNAQYFMSAFRNNFLLKEAFWPMNASFLAHSKTNLFYLLPGLFP